MLSDDSDLEEGSNITNKLYAQLMQDKDFLLTMQPRLYEAKESDDDEQAEEIVTEEKLSNMFAAESMALDES